MKNKQGQIFTPITRPAKSTGLPSRLVYRSTGWYNISTDLEKNHFWYLIFFSLDFNLFFMCIHCLMIGSLQPVTKYMLFDN